MMNTMPDLEVVNHNQVLPLYRYSKQIRDETLGGIFDYAITPSPVKGHVVKDNILDKSLEDFRANYQDDIIEKDDIFFYYYGILNHSNFKSKYHNDLVKDLPKIPYAPDFWAFAEAGRRLGELHVHYEKLDGYELQGVRSPGFDTESDESYKFGKEKQKLAEFKNGDGTRTLKINEQLMLTGIPAEALRYKVNGKSALGWLADRYQIHVDKKTKQVSSMTPKNSLITPETTSNL